MTPVCPSLFFRDRSNFYRVYGTNSFVDALWRPLPTTGKGDALYRRIRDAIVSGELSAGTQLPATRVLAKALQVSRNVIHHAYARLSFESHIVSRPGAGTFVAKPQATEQTNAVRPTSAKAEKSSAPRMAATLDSRSPKLSRETPRRYDFAFARVEQDPKTHEHWLRTLQKHAKRSSGRYSSSQGLFELREHIAAFLWRYRGVRVSPAEILLVSGSQQAIDLCARSFAEPGDIALVESPGYHGAQLAFEFARLHVKNVPVDEKGLLSASLPDQSSENQSTRLLFCTPTHQIPLGGVLPLSRRRELLDWANRHSVIVLEDDFDGLPYYASVPHEPPSLYKLSGGQGVVYTGTFSLLLFPGIRLGYLCARADIIEKLTVARWICDRHNPELLQAALCDFMGQPRFHEHLQRRRLQLEARRQTLIEALTLHFEDTVQISGSDAGTFLVAKIVHSQVQQFRNHLENDPELRIGWIASKAIAARPSLVLELCYAALTPRQIKAGVARIALWAKRSAALHHRSM